jgi:hypothetical protein
MKTSSLQALFSFQLLGQRFGIECTNADLWQLLQANWGELASTDLQPEVLIRVNRAAGELGASADTSELLYALEHEVVVELQRRRCDLYFLHAAAAEIDGQACLLVAPSGVGKSTTVFALLQHGFRYLSDELAPMELASMHVHGYPHALCLKQPPPAPYRMPPETVRGSRTWHVPATCLPQAAAAASYPAAAIFFLDYSTATCQPSVRSISTGEAAARLYANTLNQLAHPNAGLDAASHIARSVPGFVLNTADLDATCSLIRSTLDG